MNLSALQESVLEGRPAGVSAAGRLAELDLTPFDPGRAQVEDEIRLGGLQLLEGRLSQAAELLPAVHPLHGLARALQGEPGPGHPLGLALSAGELPPAEFGDRDPASFYGALAALCALREMWNWVEWAPAALQLEVNHKLQRGSRWLDTIPGHFAVLQPLLHLERARYLAFCHREDDCLEMLRQLFSTPCSIEQLPVLERARQLLRHLDAPDYDISRLPRQSPPSRLAEWRRFQQALELAPTFTRAPDHGQLRGLCLDAMVAILRCHQAFWLEPEESGWVSRLYRGPAGYMRWSQTLVERCLQEGPILYTRPPTPPSVSLILSEARSVLVCPVGALGGKVRAVIYVSHQSLEGRYAEGDLELVQFLAHLAAVQWDILDLRERRSAAASWLTRQREDLERSLDEAGVGAAWLDRQGRLQNWNQALKSLLGGLPKANEDLALRWLRQDQNAYQSFLHQAIRQGEKAEMVVRLFNPDGGLRWIKTTLDGVPEDEWQLLLVEDVTAERAEDVLVLLEQEHHALAAEIHDGPAQVAAALSLGQSRLTPLQDHALALLRREIGDVLGWLRSPSQDGLAMDLALQDVFALYLPEVEVSVAAPSDLCWTAATIAVYRCLQDLADHLSDHCLFATLWLQLTRQGNLLRVVVEGDGGGATAALDEERQQLIVQRLGLVRGEWLPQESMSRWVIEVPL